MFDTELVLEETSAKAIGQRLAFARIRAGFSGREASMFLGLYMHALVKYEQGIRPIRWRLLEELGHFFPVDPLWVFYGELLPAVHPILRRMEEEVPDSVGPINPALRAIAHRNSHPNADLIRRAVGMKALRGFVPPQVLSVHTGIPMFYADWLPEGVRGGYLGGDKFAVFVRRGDEAYYFHAIFHIVARGDKAGVCFEAMSDWEKSVERMGLLLAYGQALRRDVRLVEEYYGPKGVEAVAGLLGVPAERLREV